MDRYIPLTLVGCSSIIVSVGMCYCTSRHAPASASAARCGCRRPLFVLGEILRCLCLLLTGTRLFWPRVEAEAYYLPYSGKPNLFHGNV